MSPLATVGTPSLSHRIASARDGKSTPSTVSDSDSKRVAPLMIRTDFDDFHWETFEALPTSPLQETHPLELPPPQAVDLARTGKGYIGIITSENDVSSQVQPQTTHLTFKQCPLSSFACLSTPNLLVVLDVANCNLEQVPPELAHCSALEELNISNNPLGDSAADTTFAPLLHVPRLRMLLADNCNLTKIPVEIMSLAYLHILGLRRNQLTHMPTWLSRLDYLQVLLIEGNMNMAAPWRSVLTPLLEMEHTREREPIDLAQLASGKSGAVTSEPRRPGSSPGLFQRIRSGTARVTSNPERPSKWFRNKDSTPPADTVRNGAKPSPPSATLRSLMVPVSTPSHTTLFPMPVPGEKNEELPFPSFFLPIYDKDEADASFRWLRKYGVLHVRHLLEYLRDMDDLRPEQHRETVPVSLPMGSSNLGSPGITYSAISSVAGSDSVPLDTPGEVALRGGILEEAGANIFASPSTGTSTPGGSVEVKENPVKRGLVLNEVIETERTYVAGLSELMDIYVQGARKPLEVGGDERVMSVAMERRVFGHVEGIVHFHRDAFLPSLEQATDGLRTLMDTSSETYAITTAQVAADVANVFSEHAAYFKMYMNYVNQYETAVSTLSKWSDPSATRSRPVMKASGSLTNRAQRLLHSDSPVDERSDDMVLSASEQRRFQSYLRRCRRDPRHSQISLEGYLLLPIQRIPRYRMMLDQLIKCTSCDMLPDSDRESLARAFAHISLVASWVNEGKRQSEQGRRLLQWQSKLRGNFSAPLVQPHRRLGDHDILDLRDIEKKLNEKRNQQIAEAMAAEPAMATTSEPLSLIDEPLVEEPCSHWNRGQWSLSAQAEREREKQPIPVALQAIRDTNNNVFGAFVNEPLHICSHYYGSGECFLWKTVQRRLPVPPSATDGDASQYDDLHPDLAIEVFRWTGKNDYMVLSESDYLSVGGGDGRYGLWLDEKLDKGLSAKCPAFHNEVLCNAQESSATHAVDNGPKAPVDLLSDDLDKQPKAPETGKFHCLGVEVWAVGLD
ncbi:hypothetical protein MCAP1_002624 [Malassezia caprae]|uniref:DH domain-containing protein n=1 Tax=Malassezia caprae TaxID=1381934 RepID=A0AAF0J0V4_9BASI|nr:hypothetical protein MCAP1_002624 [Malassezia caprae]